METLFQPQQQGGGGGCGDVSESPIDVFGDLFDLSDAFSCEGPDPRRERSGEKVDVAGGNKACPGRGSAPGVAQSDGLHPPPPREHEERPFTSKTAKKDRKEWDFSKTHPGARYEGGKWLPPKGHDGSLPTFLDDVSWDEEYMEKRARAVSDAKKKKLDSKNEQPGSESEGTEGQAGTRGPRMTWTALWMSLLMVLGVFVIAKDASGWDASCRTCLRSVLEAEPETPCTQIDPSSTLEREPEEESAPTAWDLLAKEFQELVDGPWV